jgi:peptidyl-tRNA hydrolase
MLTNNNNVKKKVYIFAGNQREGLQGTYHNIGWEIANNWEKNLKWEEKDNSLMATAQNGDILIKPIAKNPMDYDKNHKFAKSIHEDDYYGRGDNYTNGYGSGDYNSAGISVQELINNDIIKSGMDCIIVSDNVEIDQNKTQFLSDARYFRDAENNAIKDILMRNNNIIFNRFDIGTKQTKAQKSNTNHHHSKIENIDILNTVNEIKKHYNINIFDFIRVGF